MNNIFTKIIVITVAIITSSLAFSAVMVDLDMPAKSKDGLETAIFAGGCFWCTESDFDKVPGVVSTTSGYTGGTVKNPSYEEVSAGGTGHAESVLVTFDPKKISYSKLLKAYWLSIDPLTANRQFCDGGNQYRSAIFYSGEKQKKQALAYKKSLEDSKFFKQPIVTEITAATEFYPAEEYHQDYHNKNPVRYNYYRSSCGRDARLKQVWGKKK
ncbi:MAG: peptide-methionine (S)-S-oxide reductase MsrA [Saprospiraceae bacterium]|nr:peptide-methionine (S)-S-oxide reductase MsrA [Saprospiraceae bacterium]